MFFIRFGDPSQPVSWSTRILMILGSIVFFSFLFFFAFSFFVIALVAGGVALIAQLFLRKPNFKTESSTVKVYRSSKNDDDIIDI